jgi:hypothetical protein
MSYAHPLAFFTAGIVHDPLRVEGWFSACAVGDTLVEGGVVLRVHGATVKSCNFRPRHAEAQSRFDYPLLIGRYAPTYGSPARAAGDNPTCLSAPVNAIDVFVRRVRAAQTAASAR